MTVRRFAIGIVAPFVAGAVIAWLLVGCLPDSPPSTDAGADPSINECCDYFIAPFLFDDPQTCLEDHTDVGALEHGQCRWLQCLGGLVTYEVCNR